MRSLGVCELQCGWCGDAHVCIRRFVWLPQADADEHLKRCLQRAAEVGEGGTESGTPLLVEAGHIEWAAPHAGDGNAVGPEQTVGDNLQLPSWLFPDAAQQPPENAGR